MKLITIESIKALDPCEDGFDNLLKHYPKFKGSLSDFLALEEISYYDKTWLIKKVGLSKKIAQQWAAECAESVIYIYEKEFPDDFRIRNCIKATNDYLDGNISRKKLEVFKVAANDAYANNVATNAAYANNVATNAAYVSYAKYAAYATYATYAATAAANVYNTYATYSIYNAKQEHQDLNLGILIDLLDNA